ncbi:ABC transporter ATP-binding protein [Granulibacter bethesdensis]|uniref:ABC transporter ATP-binding protein n=1 Tax=Granulibacter bethesdensis TaxID=364410 RepID=UPI0003F1FD42|nr:ABC transporter ATP-binding protein [Granulibacter bethesdensis]AHJ64880.1 Multidrug resistance ABC transporter ATP-binding and permease protein [Granulibacter bethesdensis CGDNIH4]APH58792.1 Multidrug resistance ABC transporter ATP-binding and permease protein [Granulibacter bethesdensis]
MVAKRLGGAADGRIMKHLRQMLSVKPFETVPGGRVNNDNQTRSLPTRTLPFIFHYVRRHPVGHLTVLLSVLMAVSFATFSQYGVKNLVDVLSGNRVDEVWSAFAILAGLIAADNMSWRIGGWVSTHTFVAVTGDLRRDLFEHLTGHSPAYFADRLPGMLAGRITATGNAIFQLEQLFAWNVLPPTFAVVLSVAMLALVSPLMSATLALISLGLGAVLMIWAARGNRLHERYATDAARVDGELVDVINNMPLVRAFGATLRERERFAARVQDEMSARGHSLRYLERLRLFHAVFTAALTAGLLVWAILLWQHKMASTGDVVLVTTLGFNILHGTRDLAVALVNMVQDVARLSEALATLLLPHDLRDQTDAHTLPSAVGAVEFRDVTFAYPGASPVLKKFNLVVPAGQRVGLVGRSGSGKTTVLTLMQRLRELGEGQILIDGHNIATMTQESLRDAISIVPQDVMLFHRSVIDNIRYGKPDASFAEVEAAAEAACCRDFIDDLTEGYDTIVGDRGVKLSGGQRQRLAIARAFLRNAPVLVLDEATSALDSESERAVQRALDRLMQGRTVIAVAHRLSTLKNFDRIVVMQHGRILQDGSPSELERNDGPFRDLLLQQTMMIAAE